MLQRVIARWRRRALRSAFERWADQAALVGERGRRVAHVGALLVHKETARAVRQWRAAVRALDAKDAGAKILARVARRWRKPGWPTKRRAPPPARAVLIKNAPRALQLGASF